MWFSQFFDPIYEGNRRAASQKWFEAMMTGRPILGIPRLSGGMD